MSPSDNIIFELCELVIHTKLESELEYVNVIYNKHDLVCGLYAIMNLYNKLVKLELKPKYGRFNKQKMISYIRKYKLNMII